MASDSRVSGSDDVRSPVSGSEGVQNVPPESGDRPTEGRPSSKDRESRRNKGGRETRQGAQEPRAAGRKTGDAGRDDRKGDKREAVPAAGGRRAEDSPGAQQGATAQTTAAQAVGAANETPPRDPSDESQESLERRESLWSTLVENRFLLLNAMPSWMVSMVFHAALLILLALLTLPERPPEQRIVAVANPNEMQEIENLPDEQIDALNVEVFEGQAPAELTDVRTTTAEMDVPSMDDLSAAPEQIKLESFGEFSALPEAMMDRIGGGVGSGLGEVRGAQARRAMVEKYGGSAGSEAAVAAALKWIAEHQMRDGGWDFDHTRGPCNGRCSHPGTIPPSRNGATAMALLPFLGAGQTHKEGKYKENVQRGLAFLVRSMKLGNGMGDLSDAGGRMYSHGLAAITLCEAYAMTNDPGLLQPAQLSLNYIVYAQDPIGGGWRYKPHQAGDTSVVGWQLMACKSGHMAYLKVPRKTILGASKFLDFVQTDNGAKYGYTVPAKGPATTAVGLLCRMYLGWKKDNPSLQAGVEYLHEMGPTKNMYYNYYATQVMRHYGGQFWDEWNEEMRDWLVEQQDQRGHAKGSWYVSRSPHADRGGRLYCTSMATMILEVYYRHMPIYGTQAAEEEFPL